MLTGTAAGQLVSLLLSPALTRIYSPQQFGVLSVYTALLTILVVIASLRYELTIPMASVFPAPSSLSASAFVSNVREYLNTT